MQLVTFEQAGRERYGVLDETRQNIVDIYTTHSELPATVLEVIDGGDATLAQVQAAVDACEVLLPLEDVRLLSPIGELRRNVFCIGKNYRDHVKEVQQAADGTSISGDAEMPESPIFFTKATTTLNAPDQPIDISADHSESTDYEGELAIIIGKPAKNVSPENVFEYIFGYSILNDVTARRIQKKHNQWFLGKSLDGYCPLGPSIVTADEIDDVTALSLTTRVNDEIRQQGSLSDLIFDIPTIIATLTKTMTLLPGDVIATGTPAGVGIGFHPPKFLQSGDIVDIEITGLGLLSNPIR